jgi:4-hydroxythreonine-4-phosphate dehydrogenase
MKLGITIGDPCGIGPELVVKTLFLLQKTKPRLLKEFIVIGNRNVLERANKEFLNAKLNFKGLTVIDAFEQSNFSYGKAQKEAGVASMLCLNLASYLIKTKVISGVITGPVSKHALALADFPFAGQTEYFACEFGAKNYAMLIWTKRAKIILVTIHLPLAEVPSRINSQAVLDKIVMLNKYLRFLEGISKPEIGVLALNPHGMEFSKGEEKLIKKAIVKAQKRGIKVFGPMPADSAFIFSHRELYHGYVSMYHDQGMIAGKLLSCGQGVNVTLGLPFIRTAPLHGVAFDIAGKGIADPGSFLSALSLARKLSKKQKWLARLCQYS